MFAVHPCAAGYTNIALGVASPLAVGWRDERGTEEVYYLLEGSITMTTVAADGREHTQVLSAGDAHAVKLGQGHCGIAGPQGVRFITVAVRAAQGPRVGVPEVESRR